VDTNVRGRNAGLSWPFLRTVPYAGMIRIRFDGLALRLSALQAGHPNGC